jgi:hypothetical protein
MFRVRNPTDKYKAYQKAYKRAYQKTDKYKAYQRTYYQKNKEKIKNAKRENEQN